MHVTLVAINTHTHTHLCSILLSLLLFHSLFSLKSGFSWNCLRYRMQPGTLYSIIADTKNIPDGYPASLTQTGGVICNDIHGHFLIDVLASDLGIPTRILPFFTCTWDYIPWSCVDILFKVGR